jgi:predicted transcriptional regulator
MAVFTSSLPDDVLAQLSAQAERLSVPKNKLIEKALRIYLEQLTRLEYIHSFSKAAKDQDMISLAEEGMVDYLKQIEINEKG